MSVLCRILDWDTAFFGTRIARLEAVGLTNLQVAEALAWCRARQVCGLYFLCNAADTTSVRAAEAHHFQLMDVRVDLDRPLDDSAAGDTSATRTFREADRPVLAQIARDSLTDSRFYQDPHFTRAQADALYEAWITRCLAEGADRLLIAETASGVAGFITCEADGGDGRIGLLCVAEEARGQGLGAALVAASLDRFAALGVPRIRVATQARNISAQRLYQHAGFRTRTVYFWYHYWFETEQCHD